VQLQVANLFQVLLHVLIPLKIQTIYYGLKDAETSPTTHVSPTSSGLLDQVDDVYGESQAMKKRRKSSFKTVLHCALIISHTDLLVIEVMHTKNIMMMCCSTAVQVAAPRSTSN